MPKTDRVAIVGAGITGACIARVLSMFESLEVHLIEKEVDVGWGSSKANTAIIHAGYDDDPEKYPVRARFCAKGNALWRKTWIKELNIPANWPGDLVIATKESEIKTLGELSVRGKRNGVPNTMTLWDKKELAELEPNITPMAVAALYAPSAGQVRHPVETVVAVVENAVDNGVRLHLATEVKDIRLKSRHVVAVETSQGCIEADWVINAAGLYADVISKMVGIGHFGICPRRGEYILFDKFACPKTKKILFPAPTESTKGVVVTTTVDGNLMLGPNACDLSKEEGEATNTTLEGLDFVWKEAQGIVSALPPRDKIIRTFAGLRAEPEPSADFIIRAYDEVEGFVNVAGIRSPGLTSAPAIANEIVEIMKDRGAKMVKKKKWNPYRKRAKAFRETGYQGRDRLIKANPLYAKIVCQCELVTEEEIIEAIRKGATTIDGIKFRTQAAMGECQGSFCEFKIAQILAREMHVPVWTVTKSGPGSEIGIGDITVLVEEREAKKS
jgi:glycerol-3-phosphate dehydrogenase